MIAKNLPASALLVLSFALLPAGRGSVADTERPASDPAREFETLIRPLLQSNCLECHGPEEREGGVDFSRFIEGTEALRKRSLWKRAAARVAAGEMPPEGEKPLAPTDRDRLVRWMRLAADRVDMGPAHRDPGPPPLRRLTRTEYKKTVSDLLDLNLDVAEAVGMPEHEGDTFETLDSELGLSASLMDKYFAAADRAVDALFARAGRWTSSRKPPSPTSTSKCSTAWGREQRRTASEIARRPRTPLTTAAFPAWFEAGPIKPSYSTDQATPRIRLISVTRR